MPITETAMNYEDMQAAIANPQNVCQECSGRLSIAWGGDGYILRCTHDITHKGISREPVTNYFPGSHVAGIPKKEYGELESKHGTEVTTALAQIQSRAILNKEQATFLVQTLWGDAPAIEKAKAVALCVNYQLNPLMKHVYLVGYRRKDGNGKDWSMMLGIQANRLIASRQGRFSYIDNSPRLMNEEEQKSIFGDVSTSDYRAICKLRDCTDDTTAQGYGVWPKSNQPKGTDKGNTPQNMAFVRAERQALDRLRPGEMPQNVEVIDADYEEVPIIASKETGEIIEVLPETDVIPEPEVTEKHIDGDTVTEAEVEELKVALADYGKVKHGIADRKDAYSRVLQGVGVFCKAQEWQVKALKDLNRDQLRTLHQALNDGKI